MSSIHEGTASADGNRCMALTHSERGAAWRTLPTRSAAPHTPAIVTPLNWSHTFTKLSASPSCHAGRSPPSNRGLASASSSMASSSPLSSGVSLLSAEDSAALDADLMSTPGFSIDQLMELAGLSVASAITKVYPPPSRVLIICGPGNNGGDGLVAARHLWHFGYQPTCLYPKPTPRQLFTNLVEQCEQLGIEFLPSWAAAGNLDSYDVVLDAMFGFGFKGDPRPPFDAILADLSKLGTSATTPKLVSIDVPSGWSVDEGHATGSGLKPDMLVSLTAPKLSARFFGGVHHFLGGRFVPPGILTKYRLKLPSYPGSEQCVRLEEWGQQREGAAKSKKDSGDAASAGEGGRGKSTSEL